MATIKRILVRIVIKSNKSAENNGEVTNRLIFQISAKEDTVTDALPKMKANKQWLHILTIHK